MSALRSRWVALLCLAVACGIEPGVEAQPHPVVTPVKADAGVGRDAGVPGDAGGEPGDAGQPESDAGEPLDASWGPLEDAGQTSPPDAGAQPFDAGAHPVDAGTVPDAGPRDAGDCPQSSNPGVTLRLRAMAANLSSGNGQDYDLGDGQNIMRGVHPDIVMIQEFNINSSSDFEVSKFATSLSGDDAGMYWARGGFGQIPNGVISRWPILESGDWTDPQVGNRAFTWAHIDLPGPRDLWVVSLHLLTSSAGERNSEGKALVAQLQAHVPATDFLLIGGDFNTDSRTEAVISTLAARVVTSGAQPVDQANKGGTNASRDKPYDWVLASRCLNVLKAPVVIGLHSFTNGLVVDTRVYTPIADLAPATSGDSASSNMQHMGVVKDFWFEP